MFKIASNYWHCCNGPEPQIPINVQWRKHRRHSLNLKEVDFIDVLGSPKKPWPVLGIVRAQTHPGYLVHRVISRREYRLAADAQIRWRLTDRLGQPSKQAAHTTDYDGP